MDEKGLGEGQGHDESYEIQLAPWHASHALISEYATVLHLHRVLSSGPLGPVYVYPGISELIVNAAEEIETARLIACTQDKHSQPPVQVAIKYAATVHAFWPSELNVCLHFSLRTGQLERTNPSPRQATIWSINLCDDQARKEKQGDERGEICHLGWHLGEEKRRNRCLKTHASSVKTPIREGNPTDSRQAAQLTI